MEADRELLTTAARRWGEIANYLAEVPDAVDDDSDGA